MKDDKILVIDYFNFKFIEARHYPKTGKGEKPDFELFIKANLFGFCELKSIIDYEFSGLRNDPTYNKIQAKIHKSSKQFKSVNSSHN